MYLARSSLQEIFSMAHRLVASKICVSDLSNFDSMLIIGYKLVYLNHRWCKDKQGIKIQGNVLPNTLFMSLPHIQSLTSLLNAGSSLK